MTDQPKPNPPVQPAAPAQPLPKEAPSAADKEPTASSSEPKAPSTPVEAKRDAAPAPVNSAPPAAQPAKSDGADSAPTVPNKPAAPAPVNNVPPAAQPPKPASSENSPAQPAAPATSASPVAQPAKPVTAADDKPQSSPAVPPVAQPAKPVTAADDKPQSSPAAPPASSSSPTEKRDIGDDPTLPGKPEPSAPTLGVTRSLGPPSVSGAPISNDKEDTIPPASSAAKVTQRFSEPSPVGQASAGTICPSCGHRNRPGTLICDNCGTNLIGGTKAAVGTRDLVAATEAAATDSEPLMDAAQLNAVESAGGSIFSDDMVLRIEIEGGATPMLVYPKQEIILGRRDPNTGTLPDVDMTAYSGYRMGVSRTHASIHLQDRQLNLSDRGSSNGTFLNGTRLVAHRPYPVKDGDEIRLGQMVLKVYFQSNKGRK